MCPHCDEVQIKSCQKCGELIDFSKPRALVAISEDRQWLVVHRPKEGRFLVYEEFHFDSGQACYGEHGGTDDTGQSAEDVLAAWLEEGQG